MIITSIQCHRSSFGNTNINSIQKNLKLLTLSHNNNFINTKLLLIKIIYNYAFHIPDLLHSSVQRSFEFSMIKITLKTGFTFKGCPEIRNS